MKKINIVCLLLASVSSAFAQKDKAVVKATITGLEAGKTVYWRSFGADKSDSVLTTAGGFSFEAPMPKGSGDMYFVHIGKDYAENTAIYMYLDRGTTTINGKGPFFKDAVFAGTQSAKDFADYQAFVSNHPVVKAAPQLYAKANELYRKGDTAALKLLEPQFKEVDSIKLANGKIWLQKHSSSPAAGAVLASFVAENIGTDETEKILNSLEAAAKDNKPVKRLLNSIETEKATAIGKAAREFTQEDTAGRPVSLKDFRGKYVLVDFWASWCKPCRAENPNVVKAFKKYSDKNFTVLGVSLDQKGQKDRWLKAIYDDQLTWTHVSDLNFWNNAVAKLYDVRAIPANLLIDPNGVIVAKNLHGEELENKLAELLN